MTLQQIQLQTSLIICTYTLTSNRSIFFKEKVIVCTCYILRFTTASSSVD